MRALAAAAAATTALALTACGGDDEQSSPVRSDAQRVGAAVRAFERALAARDFERVCRRIFSEALREQLGGDDCPQALERSGRGLRQPQIEVSEISLQDGRAVVEVVTSTARQPPARDAIVLVREGGGYRVDGLGPTPDA